MSQQTKETSTEDIPRSPIAGGDSRKRRESPRRIALYLGLGAALVYLGTWLGNVFFYLYFQRPLLAQSSESGGGVIAIRAQEARGGDSREWEVGEESGLELPLPPGRLAGIKKEGDLLLLQFQEGLLSFQSLPAGYVAAVLARELEILGEPPARDITDTSALQEVMEEDLGDYQFSWPASRRRQYAARILSKMLLWDNQQAKRVELASRREPHRIAALVEYENGNTKIMVTRERGVVVVNIPPEAPVSWKATPASWLAGKK